jgi:hypothetical protein
MSARRFPIVTASKLRRFLLVGASEVDSEALRTLGVMGRRADSGRNAVAQRTLTLHGQATTRFSHSGL